MSFLETPRLDDVLARWVVGGRGFNTAIVETYGGDEYRNAAWSQARGEYDFAEALRSTNPTSVYAYKTLRNMFLVCRGRLYGFRMRDWNDYQDEGGGTFVLLTATTFQMYKTYTVSPLTYTQIVQKPQPASGSYAGVVVTGGTTPVVDYTTGIVTVASGTPSSWTGQFDIPVRFADDMPKLGLDPTGAFLNYNSLRVVEIRNP